MTGRDLMIAVIHEVVRGLPIEEVTAYANELPTHVQEGGEKFCEDSFLGPWFHLQLVDHNISVAYELYRFIDESKLSVVQTKEVKASGDKQK